MNLRKVAILLIISLSFATVLPGFSADFQQVEIKGPKNSSEEYSGTIYGPIDSSDTLWRIANRYRQNKNLTIYQVMLAIYRLNPTAFEENNLNLLKDGSTLRLPSERYIARINKSEALAKSQQDEVVWQSKLPPNSKALIDNLKPAEKLASKTDLDQTKQVLEQRLGAIDEEQNRQFMAIRQQFAESINSVQTILNENQKLFERLDSVNTDLSDLRSGEAQRDQQIGQMGLSIEELLKKSREEDQNKKAAEADNSGSDWLRDPITLIIITLVMSLILLAGFGYWLVGRKKQEKLQGELAAFANEPPPIPHSTELDDLSDALSNELSEELDKELDDGDLFGEDDLLDDVLSQELEESLDDSENDQEDFDEFGDEMLVPAESAGEADFDSDDEIVEHEDLDSLFDEDDDLLAEIDEDIDSIDLSDTDQEEDSIDLSDTGQDDDVIEAGIYENGDIQDDIEEFDEDDIFEESGEIEKPSESELEERDAELASDNLSKIKDEQEKPEISIDELLDEQRASLEEGVNIDEPDQINEEMLQQLGKEITSQSEELDGITETLLDELELVEQKRSELPEEYEFDEAELSNNSNTDHQHDIQKLDELTDEFDDDLLSDASGDDLVEMTEDELALEAELNLSEEEAELDTEAELDEESELDKALEDFEDIQAAQPLDSSADDLEFAEMQADNAELAPSDGDRTDTPAILTPLPDLDDIGSLTDFDDAELEKALEDIDSAEDQQDQQPKVEPDIENKELKDVPGLGDWLSDSEGKEDSDKVLLDELENSSFDELLESIDIDEGEKLQEEVDDSDLDIEALLGAKTVDELPNREKKPEENDFLDVEALLTESIDAESTPLTEKNLDLDTAFGEFAGVTNDSDSVDVDGDQGIGAKLDLAHAYIEIGEIDSAKELLEEIIAKGNSEQVEEAQVALSKLA